MKKLLLMLPLGVIALQTAPSALRSLRAPIASVTTTVVEEEEAPEIITQVEPSKKPSYTPLGLFKGHESIIAFLKPSIRAAIARRTFFDTPGLTVAERVKHMSEQLRNDLQLSVQDLIDHNLIKPSRRDELHLDHQYISSLEGLSHFHGKKNVRSLYLNNNLLSSITPNAFEGFENLDELYLFENQLSSLTPGAFTGLSNLSSLYVENNRLSEIEPGAFAGLDNLTSLNVTDNRLTVLEPGVFSNLTKLRELKLSGNSIAPEEYQRIMLEVADATGNKLFEHYAGSYGEGVAATSGTSSGASAHEVSDQRSQFEEEMFGSVPHEVLTGNLDEVYALAEFFSAKGNSVAERRDTMSPELQDHLKLSVQNLIDYGLVPAIRSGGVLDLSGLSLQSLEGLAKIPGIQQVKHLKLNNNHIKTVPQRAFAGLTGLEILDLTGNHISSLVDGAFWGLANLEVLSLTDNNLTELPFGSFHGLPKLRSLWLNTNKLAHIADHAFFGLVDLNFVDLSENELERVPGKAFAGNRNNLKTIDLDENRISAYEKDHIRAELYRYAPYATVYLDDQKAQTGGAYSEDDDWSV